MEGKARQRLAVLRRGEVLPIPNRTWVYCPGCDAMMPWSLAKCSKCKEPLPPRPPARCRLCHEPLPKRRRSWCGDECKDAYYLATNSYFLRQQTKRRDNGVCAGCNLDTTKLRQRVNGFKVGEPGRQQALQVLKDQGFNVPTSVWARCPSLWDADHIEALDEGGSYELSNVQTLCHPCHKAKTSEHASRKGKQRRLMGKKAIETNRRLRILGAM